MTNEQAINKAFDEVVAHLREQRDTYLADAVEYENLTSDDVIVWLIESF